MWYLKFLQEKWYYIFTRKIIFKFLQGYPWNCVIERMKIKLKKMGKKPKEMKKSYLCHVQSTKQKKWKEATCVLCDRPSKQRTKTMDSHNSSSLAMAPSSPASLKSGPLPHLNFLSSLTSTFLSRLPFSPKPVQVSAPVQAPVPVCSPSVVVPFLLPVSNLSTAQPQSRSVSPRVRLEGLSSMKSGGGPAFVGQVFTMLDSSGKGLMAVTRHLNLPFLSMKGWILFFSFSSQFL